MASLLLALLVAGGIGFVEALAAGTCLALDDGEDIGFVEALAAGTCLAVVAVEAAFSETVAPLCGEPLPGVLLAAETCLVAPLAPLLLGPEVALEG